MVDHHLKLGVSPDSVTNPPALLDSQVKGPPSTRLIYKRNTLLKPQDSEWRKKNIGSPSWEKSFHMSPRDMGLDFLPRTLSWVDQDMLCFIRCLTQTT